MAFAPETALNRPHVLLVENDVHDREPQSLERYSSRFSTRSALPSTSLSMPRRGCSRKVGGSTQGLSWTSISRALLDIAVDAEAGLCEGFGVIAELRALGRRYPIVIVSHNSGVEYEIRGFEAGADDYIVKWPQREEMRARLGRLIPGGTGQDRDMRSAGDDQ